MYVGRLHVILKQFIIICIGLSTLKLIENHVSRATYHTAKVRTNPAKYALRKSQSLTSKTYMALFITALSACFLKMRTSTKIRFCFSVLYSSCSQCILFTNCGVNSWKISSRRLCKCPILDMFMKNKSNEDLNLLWGSPYQVTKNSTHAMQRHRDSLFPCRSLDKTFAGHHF